MQKKIKVLDLAKDLNLDNNKIIDAIAKYGNGSTRKKPSSAVSEEEINIVLEHLTQNNQVASFDSYLASKNSKEGDTTNNNNNNRKNFSQSNDNQRGNNSKQEQPRKDFNNNRKRTNNNFNNNTNNNNGNSFNSNNNNSNFKKRTNNNFNNNNNSNSSSNNNGQKQSYSNNGGQKFNNGTRKPQEQFNKTDNKSNNNFKNSTQPKKQHAPRGEKTTLNVNMASNVSTDNKPNTRTVDTRSSTSYIDLDKYNERYEQIAPANRQKDNYTKKQKISQKSAQKNKQKYSSKKETESEKLRRLELERARKQQLKVLIPDEIVVSELATRLKVTVSDVIKKLMGLGVMASINETIDFDTASLVAEEFNAKVEKEVIITIEERLIDDSDDDNENVEERCPVVVVMGHVDHGKTSILDRIRNAHVTASEAGGITQHIGAYQVKYQGKDITFLDTPGHEAFTSMRARGANITDIAILVVASDDGIMPQTIESINHAKAAGVTLIVAINKIDKEGANPERVKQELTEHGIVCEEWGGDTICVPVSAKTGEGIEELLENILLVAEVKELKANPNRLAKGTVIEAKLDKGRGPVATVLVQNGTLNQGDVIIAGTSVGRVRVMTNDKGLTVKKAGPSVPVEITGLAEVPSAGDTFNAVEDEKLARELVEQRKHEAKQEQFKSYQKVTLDNLFSQIEQGEIKELPIIVKADVQGSVEAVKQSLEKLSNNEVRVKVIHGAVGAVSESDVMLASVSNAIIVGFNVRPDPVASESAERDGVDIRLYRIIYDAIDEITTAMKGMLAPKFREVQLGRAEVRNVFKISNVGQIAGSYVLDGKISRNAEIRVVRDGIVICEDKIDSLKRFKDDAKEVASGFECGIGLTKFNDIKEGDILEAFIMEEYRED
ncbi:MAG: translation initiation factor IF-2 [Ruminococcus sp.]|nr:translation initiation factor IF-2 [Ruminococcus sp.]